MCPLVCEKHILLNVKNTSCFNRMCFSHTILIALIEKTCASHMFKWHILLLYVDCTKCPTKWFVRNFCLLFNWGLGDCLICLAIQPSLVICNIRGRICKIRISLLHIHIRIMFLRVVIKCCYYPLSACYVMGILGLFILLGFLWVSIKAYFKQF
jgi:hypothetical protein